MDDNERPAFFFINCCLAWIDKATSLICIIYASRMHQCAPNLKVFKIIDQIVILQKLKNSELNYLMEIF